MIGTVPAIALVARREIVERLRERSLWVSTAITVAVSGPQAAAAARQAVAQQRAFDVELTIRPVSDDATARRLVRDGDADVAVLAGGRALFAAQDADDSVVSAVQAGSQAARGGRLPPPLPVVTEGGSSASDRQGIAFVAVVILYGQLLGYGFWVATGVVEEKSTRVVELLLSAIRPRQLLAGKVIGIGLLGLGQLILIGLCGVIIGAASGQLDVNGDVVAAVGVVMLWFLLGFALYSCAFAVAGALVPRQEDIQAVTAPLTILILASFFLSFGALDDPSSTLARVLSLIPPSAPMVMPVRLIAGTVPAWEVLLSIALTVAAAAALIALAAQVYGAAVLRTGSRVTLRAVWRTAAEQAPAGRRA